MTKRLQILEQSLQKKEQHFSDKLSLHIGTVKQANGQPLNDKRNGRATLAKWDRQNEGLRNIQKGIEATKQAIEYEKGKIADVEQAKAILPEAILKLIESGELVQWRKHPTTFFVPGIDKARMVWDKNRNVLAHKFVSTIIDADQRKKFAQTYNSLRIAVAA